MSDMENPATANGGAPGLDVHATKLNDPGNTKRTPVTQGARTNARDAAITFSIAIQHGADPQVIRKALCRDSRGNASGPLGAALDVIAGGAP
jgi:hypothetical protein